MTLEVSVTHIADLDPTSPTGAEKKSDGDDNFRNIKRALRNGFPGLTGAVIVGGTNGGSANAYTLTPATPLLAYTARTVALFTPAASNTGGATLNVSGLGARAVLAIDGAPLRSGDLPLNQPVAVVDDGTAYRLLSVTKNYIDQITVVGTVPGVNTPANAGKFFTTDGTTGGWASINTTPLAGGASFNKGNSGTAAQIVNYLESGVPTEGQTITATGVFNLSASGFPVGRMTGVLLRIINGGAFPGMTSSGITWIKFDNTKTTTFSAAGITLATTGETLLALFSYGDGIIYGKAA